MKFKNWIQMWVSSFYTNIGQYIDTVIDVMNMENNDSKLQSMDWLKSDTFWANILFNITSFYGEYNILYDSNEMWFRFTGIFKIRLPDIIKVMMQQKVVATKWWEKIENYGYFNSGNNANENSYNGYDADGVFSRSKNTMSSKNGDILGYLIKMNRPMNNILNMLYSDIEMLLQTIY